MKTLFNLAEKWLNVDFRWHGFNRFGCDCFGLIVGILYENHIADDKFLKKFQQYKYGTNLEKVNFKQIIVDINNYFKTTENLIDCDVFIIKCKNSPIHFVIYEKNKQNGRIIHITQSVGKVFMTNFNKDLNIIKMFKLKENLKIN